MRQAYQARDISTKECPLCGSHRYTTYQTHGNSSLVCCVLCNHEYVILTDGVYQSSSSLQIGDTVFFPSCIPHPH